MLKCIILVLVSSFSLAFHMKTKIMTHSVRRIIGGKKTTINEYPFAASMGFESYPNTFVHFCGGVIVTPNSILTAAHCFVKAPRKHSPVKKWRARVGSSFSTSETGYIHELRKFHIHNFNQNTNENDLAVVETANSINYIPGVVAPAKLAAYDHVIPDKDVIWAIGWGKTSVNVSMVRQLRKVSLQALSNDQCNAAYESLLLQKVSSPPPVREVPVLDTMMCACDIESSVRGGSGVCTGDSGGPLIHNDTVVGVLSWNGANCNTSMPLVATRISKYTPWIKMAVRNKYVNFI